MTAGAFAVGERVRIIGGPHQGRAGTVRARTTTIGPTEYVDVKLDRKPRERNEKIEQIEVAHLEPCPVCSPAEPSAAQPTGEDWVTGPMAAEASQRVDGETESTDVKHRVPMAPGIAATRELSPSRAIRLTALHESPFNKRRTWGDLKELAESIKHVGILEILLARPHPTLHDEYELVFGHRRLRAAKLAGLSEVPCFVRELDDKAVVDVQVIENLQRTDIHPLEEAESLEQAMKVGKVSAEDLAARLGKSRSYVFQRLKLLALCEPVRKAFVADEIGASVALYIARIPRADLQLEALGRCKGDQWEGPMSAREARDYIEEEFMLRLAEAPFDRADASLVPKAGPCTTCPKRTGNQAELFADVKSADVCTDRRCYEEKQVAHGKRVLQLAKEQGKTVVAGADGTKLVDSARYGSGKYVDLDRECFDDPKRRTYRELLKGAALDVTVATDSDGDVHELVPRAAAEKALPKLKAESRAAARTGDDEKRRRQEAQRKRVRTMAVIDGIVAAAEKNVGLEKGFWKFLAAQLVDGAHHEVRVEICKRRAIEPLVKKRQYGGDHKDYEAALAKALASMSEAQAKGLAVEIVSARGSFHFGPYGGSDLGKTLVAAANFYRIDVKRVGDAAVAAAHAEKSANKRPAKKTRNKRKGAR